MLRFRYVQRSSRRFFVTLLLFLVVVSPPAQQGIRPAASSSPGKRKDSFFPLAVSFIPALSIPLGQSAIYYSNGGTASLAAQYRLPAVNFLHLRSEIGYDYVPLRAGPAISVVSAGAGGGASLDLTSWLTAQLHLTGGYYHGFLIGSDRKASGGNPYLSASLQLTFFPTSWIGLGLGAGYRELLGLHGGLYTFLATSYHLAGPRERPSPLLKARPQLLRTGPFEDSGDVLKLTELSWSEVFPIFRKYYDDHPVGKVMLSNVTSEPITDLRMSLLVKQYMDAPKQCSTPSRLEPGERQEVPLYALFTEKVLEVTEATKVAVEINLEYRSKGEEYRQSKVETLRIYDRNSMTWDDDRRAAAFVTAKDPVVLSLSKGLAGMARAAGSTEVNPNLKIAMVIHEALGLYGLKYVADPRTPYADFSKTTSKVDYLQFPRQTLEYRAGDCDDLSILYAALLESVGVATAFLTIPGHIYIAVSMQMPAEEARKEFARSDDLIFIEEQSWLPLEVTEREGFLKAWQAGAKQWRENAARRQVGFFPIQEAWKLFEPVGLPGIPPSLSMVAEQAIKDAFNAELDRLVSQEIYPQEQELLARMRSSGASPRLLNSLGVLYARYGLIQKAEKEFIKAISQEEYVPALFNLGNICYLRKEPAKAAKYFEKAHQKDPGDAKVILALARVNHEMENYGLVRDLYRSLKELAPDLAERFAYLDLRGEEAGRAAEAGGLKDTVIWAEEE